MSDDLRINGSMNVNGGSYDKVAINGDGTINTDLNCEEIKVNGKGVFKGDVECKDVKVNGKAIFQASLNTEYLKVNGEVKVNDNAEINNLKVAGAVAFDGNLTAETIDLLGTIDVTGDCASERFLSRGGFKINGLMNSGYIEIQISHSCSVKEIGGEKIIVKNAKNKFLKILHYAFLSFPLEPRLETDLIECDDIYLENVKAKIVRGNRITIGKDCEIDTVEYKSSFEKLANAAVNKHRKID